MNPNLYRKALVGGLMAGLGALAASLSGGISLVEAEGAWIAALLAGLSIYAVPNEPPS